MELLCVYIADTNGPEGDPPLFKAVLKDIIFLQLVGCISGRSWRGALKDRESLSSCLPWRSQLRCPKSSNKFSPVKENFTEDGICGGKLFLQCFHVWNQSQLLLRWLLSKRAPIQPLNIYIDSDARLFKLWSCFPRHAAICKSCKNLKLYHISDVT